MANTFVKNTIHLVFHVKCTSVCIAEGDLEHLFRFIGGTIKKMGGIPFQVGGIYNHIHIMCTLPKTISLCAFVRNIKSDSSKWLRTIHERYAAFAWQDGYGAFSVSPSAEANTLNYIRNQAKHHGVISVTDEYEQILNAYRIDHDERIIDD